VLLLPLLLKLLLLSKPRFTDKKIKGHLKKVPFF
jgi:hypothetical protein